MRLGTILVVANVFLLALLYTFAFRSVPRHYFDQQDAARAEQQRTPRHERGLDMTIVSDQAFFLGGKAASEGLITKAVFLINFPAVILSFASYDLIFNLTEASAYATSFIAAGIMLWAVTGQWLLIGAVISRARSRAA